MNALLALSALVLSILIAVFVPTYGASAVIVSAGAAVVAGLVISKTKIDKEFLLQLFVAGLLVRMVIGTVIFVLKMQEFFGGDAITYDELGYSLLRVWEGDVAHQATIDSFSAGGGWGMNYMVAAVYGLVGRNMLAVQFVNAVIGAATAPVIYLCAQHIFQNAKVTRVVAYLVAFFPSLVLWSSQGLKDGPTVFLLALAMLATLKLDEKLTFKYLAALVLALFGILSLRFYIFYMLLVAIGGAFVIGMRPITGQGLVRQLAIVVCLGLALTYLGVLRGATTQFERYGSLEALQRSRSDQAQSARSGFGQDVDVSTTSGAISAIPIGMTYLLFAPFPWQFQITNIRQSMTLPEMVVWWLSFPLLMLGGWFTVRYRLRQALPILIFTSMLTLSYAVYQGNVGTAYRQRAQLLVFYFIFVAVGYALLKERSEERAKLAAREKELSRTAGRRRATVPIPREAEVAPVTRGGLSHGTDS
ncbi:MAG: glycosyltransferase family 39 protein [Acidobacteriota bacterium]|nr:glycosyltransferase family 39 protein [Acidobacteriota bacterium]